MKITLTMTEIAALVIDRYNLPSTCEIAIVGYNGNEHPDAANLVAALRSEDCLTPLGGIRPDKKIASIKLLRELVCKSLSRIEGDSTGNYCGLAQAKYAIEDWDRFLSYVRRYGYPKMGSNDPERAWLNL